MTRTRAIWMAAILLGGLWGCSDDSADTADAGWDGTSPHRDAAPLPDAAPPGRDGGRDAAPVDAAPAPGTDPCSGNPFTPTQPSGAQGSVPPGSTQDQQEAAAYMNHFRDLIGLGAVDLNAALNQAAQAHSDYCSQDPSWCPGWHQEEPGHPGFTGENFWDRCQAAGYTGQCYYEVMAPGGTPQQAIDMWMATVYHRVPFVLPQTLEAGYGGASQFATMDFGCCAAVGTPRVLNYPVHGQTGVDTSWSGNEGPRPPAPPSGWPSGPVVSVIFPPDTPVTVTKHEVWTSDCQAVPHVAGGAGVVDDAGFERSFLKNVMVLYPNDPLRSGADYVVNVEYELDGQPGHRTFRFTTR